MTPDKFTWSAVLVSRRLRRVPGSARLCGRRHVAGRTQVCPTVGVCSRWCWWRIAVRPSSASVRLAFTRSSHLEPGLSGRATVGRIAGGYPLPGLPVNASRRDQPIQFAKAHGARRRSLLNCRGPQCRNAACKLGLISPMAPPLIGRWFALVARGQPLHRDIGQVAP